MRAKKHSDVKKKRRIIYDTQPTRHTDNTQDAKIVTTDIQALDPP